MNTKNHTREEWITWLRDERGISESVMIEAKLGIDVDNGELAIPVHAADGTFLFNKYRRSPWTEDGPKYRYTKGSTAQLYGAEQLPALAPHSRVVVTEGELDALALRSIGYTAVSSTGGSGTWRAEWCEMLKDFKVIVMYDADRAGVEGAMRLLTMMPEASVAWLDKGLGKDPTEVLINGGTLAIMSAIDNRKIYRLVQGGMTESTNLGRLKSTRSVLGAERTALMQSKDQTPMLVEYALAWVEKEIADLQAEMKRKTRPVSKEGEGDIAQAKTFPIANLIQVSRDGWASCVYHDESTPSMKYYKNGNRCYSYCCSKSSDAIDVYMAVNNTSFCEAVQALKI